MKKVIIILVTVSLIILVFVFVCNFLAENQKKEQKMIGPVSFVPKTAEKTPETVKTLKIGKNILNIEVADTNAERIQGLSGKQGLAENESMLFVFDTEGYYGIWMKDMNFSIDIVWLDKNKKIIHIEKDVSPETYPKIFYALKNGQPILSLYVLETSAGFLAQNNIQIGDFIAF